MDDNIAENIDIMFNDQVELYSYASRYWDKKRNKKSLTGAINRAMEDEECPFHIDPFESLVESGKYDEKEHKTNEKIKMNFWGREI